MVDEGATHGGLAADALHGIHEEDLAVAVDDHVEWRVVATDVDKLGQEGAGVLDGPILGEP